MSRAWPIVLPLALALAACAPPGLTSPGGGMVESRVGNGATRLAPKITISGEAKAPASILAIGGGSVIANGGGSVVANGGGSIGANGGAMFTGPHSGPLFVLLAAEALAPVADAEVVLLAADGRPFPGVAPSKTDAQGRFTMAGVPEGSVGFVEIRGKGFRLGRLMKAAAAESLRVDPVSTAVADGLRAQMKDPKALAKIEPSKLAALEVAVQAASDAGEIQIDLKPGGSADQALAQALSKRPDAARAAREAVADAKKAAAEAPPELDAARPAEPATPAQPGDGPVQPAVPARPAAPAGGDGTGGGGHVGGDHAAAVGGTGAAGGDTGAAAGGQAASGGNQAASGGNQPASGGDKGAAGGGQGAAGGDQGTAGGDQGTAGGDQGATGGGRPAGGAPAGGDGGKPQGGKPGDKGRP